MKRIVANGLRDFKYRAECPHCFCIFDFMDIDVIEIDMTVQCPTCGKEVETWREKENNEE